MPAPQPLAPEPSHATIASEKQIRDNVDRRPTTRYRQLAARASTLSLTVAWDEHMLTGSL